jgi:hypothetical protein
MRNLNSSKGAKKSGMTGPLRSPMAGNLVCKAGNLHPSIAVNTTRGDIKKASAPISSPHNSRRD